MIPFEKFLLSLFYYKMLFFVKSLDSSRSSRRPDPDLPLALDTLSSRQSRIILKKFLYKLNRIW